MVENCGSRGGDCWATACDGGPLYRAPWQCWGEEGERGEPRRPLLSCLSNTPLPRASRRSPLLASRLSPPLPSRRKPPLTTRLKAAAMSLPSPPLSQPPCVGPSPGVAEAAHLGVPPLPVVWIEPGLSGP